MWGEGGKGVADSGGGLGAVGGGEGTDPPGGCRSEQ